MYLYVTSQNNNLYPNTGNFKLEYWSRPKLSQVA